MDFISHFSVTISVMTDFKPILEQQGESVGKSCTSSKPRAHNLAFVMVLPSTNFLLRTHLTDVVQCFPPLYTLIVFSNFLTQVA